MKTFLIIILVLISYIDVNSQDCKKYILDNYEFNYYKNFNKFKRTHERVLKRSIFNYSSANYSAIYLPRLIAKSRAFDTIQFNKRNLLCYLNLEEIHFDEAIITKNSIPVGILTPCPGNCRFRFLDNNQSYFLLMIKLVEKLIEINPVLVFRIENINGVYWYIKNEELYALSYTIEDDKVLNLEIAEANVFIQSLDEEAILQFLQLVNRKIITK